MSTLVRGRHAAIAAGILLLGAGGPTLAVAASAGGFLEDAQQRYQKGDLRAAIIQLRNALQADSNDLDARRTLGRLYLESGQYEPAEKELRRAYEARPDDTTELLLGRALLALDRPEDVLKVVRGTAEEVGTAQQKTLVRAEAMLNLERLDEAAAVLGPEVAAHPLDPTANLLAARLAGMRGDLEEARDKVQVVLDVAPDSIPARLLKGQIALAEGALGEAGEAARKALDLAAGNGQAQLILAEVSFRRGQLDQAEAQTRAILEQAPNDPQAIYLAASIQAARGAYEEADRVLRQASDSLREFPPAMLLSGLLKARIGQPAQAENLLSRYVARVQGDRSARRALAAAQLQGDRAAAAIDTLVPLTNSSTQDVASLQLLSSAQLRTGDLEGARRTFRRIAQAGQPSEAEQARSFLTLIESPPDPSSSPETRRTALLVLDDLRTAQTDSALRRAQELVARTPGDLEARDLLGAVRLARGEDAEARAQFEAALAADPDDEAALTNLDRIDIRAGQLARVEERLRRHLRDRPGDEAATLRLAELLTRSDRTAEAEALLRERAAAMPRSVGLRTALAARYASRDDRVGVLTVASELRAIGDAGQATGYEAAGGLYLAEQQYGDAVATFQALSKARPEDAGARAALARSQYLAGDKAAARATLAAMREKSPGDALANGSLVDLDVESGDLAGALAFAKSLGKVDPGQSAALQAKVLLAAKRSGEAVDVLERAFRAAPDATLARALFLARRQAGEKEAAVAGLRDWLAGHPDDATNLDLLSQAMISDGDYAAAAVPLEQAIQLVPSDPAVLNNLAWLRHELGRPGDEELARRAHQLAPGAPEITDTLGWILVRKGRLDEGLALLREADAAARDNPDIQYHLAYTLDKRGDAGAARFFLEKALARDQAFTEKGSAERMLALLKEGYALVPGRR